MIFKKQIWSMVTVFLLLSFSNIAKTFADTLELLSGSNLEGKVISLDLNTIVIDQNNSRISIGKDQIRKIIFSHKQEQKQTKNNQIIKNEESKPQKDQKKESTPLKTKTKPSKDSLNKVASTNKTTSDKPNNNPTYIKGNTSNKIYLGLYNQNSNNKNLKVNLAVNKAEKLSYKLFAAKNGTIPALYTSTLVVFTDEKGNIIEKTPVTSVENDRFIEWFKNLENIAGVCGEKEISITIPKNAYTAEIIGYRPETSSNIIGYISDIKIDNKNIEGDIYPK